MADEGIISYSDLISDDGTFDDISKLIARTKKELLDLAKVLDKDINLADPNDLAMLEKLEKQTKELVQAQKNLLKSEQTLAKAQKKKKELTQEELIQREKEKIARRESVQLAKQEAIIRKSEAGSIEELRARLSKVTIQWKKLSAEERENGKTGRSLVKTKLALTNQLKKLEKQTGDTRRNVGNYTESLNRLGKTAARVFIGRSAIDGLRRIGNAFSDIIEKNKETDESIGRLSSALGQFGKSAGGLGLTILRLVSGPLTSLLNGVKSVLDFFSGAGDELNDFKATSDELAATTSKLSEEFSKELAATDQLFTSLEQANEGSKERKQIIDQINTQYGQYLPNLLTEKSTLEDIEQAQRLVNDALTKGFLIRIEQATQTDIFTNKVKSQREAFKGLQKIVESTGKTLDTRLLAAFSELIEDFDETSKQGKAARDVIESVAFSGANAAKELESTNPALAELVKQLKSVGQEDRVINFLEEAAKETDQYNKAIGDTNAALQGLNKELVTYDRSLDGNTNTNNKNTKSIADNTSARLQAIESLQTELSKLEAENLEDRQQAAFDLEDLAFQERVKQRGDNAKKLADLIKDQLKAELITKEQAEAELLDLQFVNQRIAEEQLRQHEQNKIDIRKKFAIKTIEIEAITEEDLRKQRDDFNKEFGTSFAKIAADQKAIEAENNKAIQKEREETAKKQEETTKQLLDNIGKTAELISQEITKIFEKQADLAAESVNQQQENLSRAREKAAQGLKSDIAFEEKELAKRQAEQQRREKEAAQAAKLLTLFNLVSAYAQNGDENALARGLVDFALLEAFSAGLEGFFEGTEDTGRVSSPLDGKGGRLAILHDNERVMTKAQNVLLNGMSNDDVVTNALIGSQMSDNYNPQSITSQNLFTQQKADFIASVGSNQESFNSNARIEKALINIERQLSNQPNIGLEMEKMYNNMYDIIKTEIKNSMKKRSRKRLGK